VNDMRVAPARADMAAKQGVNFRGDPHAASGGDHHAEAGARARQARRGGLTLQSPPDDHSSQCFFRYSHFSGLPKLPADVRSPAQTSLRGNAFIATEVRKQMTELRQLRELVRLAGAAKALHRPRRLARSAVNSKVVDPFAGPQLRVKPARPLATS
jgi:hypothetical protein